MIRKMLFDKRLSLNDQQEQNFWRNDYNHRYFLSVPFLVLNEIFKSIERIIILNIEKCFGIDFWKFWLKKFIFFRFYFHYFLFLFIFFCLILFFLSFWSFFFHFLWERISRWRQPIFYDSITKFFVQNNKIEIEKKTTNIISKIEQTKKIKKGNN